MDPMGMFFILYATCFVCWKPASAKSLKNLATLETVYLHNLVSKGNILAFLGFLSRVPKSQYKFTTKTLFFYLN